jgi:hypothetical protein
MGAPPMREIPAVRPTLFYPNAIGAFPNPMIIGRVATIPTNGLLAMATVFFLLVLPLLVGVLAMRIPRPEFSLALP